MRKLVAIIMTLFIVFLWVITLTDLGGVGPITRSDRIRLGLDLSGGVYVVMEAQTDATGSQLEELMKMTQLVIERRANALGVSEPVVTIEGEKRIRVEMPGLTNAEDAIATIGKTAQLQFVLADGTLVLDGSMVRNAVAGADSQKGGYMVTLEFDAAGQAAFTDGTQKAFSGSVTPADESVIPARSIGIVLDGQVISAPNVQQVISGNSCQITGNFSKEEAINLALQIKSGALPVDLKEVNASIQGAKLGLDALNNSVAAGVIGIVLIFLFMLFVYRIMGLAANIALLLYIPGILWVLSLLKGVLTLPGIAGIILSVGMAVDANVIIFARIREEILDDKSPRVAVESGFRRALGTIIDSQITTIIAAIVLYQFGTGPVRGFALTLMIGIVLSVFTAVAVTQVYLGLIAENSVLGRLKFFGVKENRHSVIELKKYVPFITHRRVYYLVTVGILVVGFGVGLIRGYNFGIDFTGGTMIQMNMGKQVEVEDVNKVLQSHQINDAEIVHAGADNTEIVIRTTKSLDSGDRVALMDDLLPAFGLDDSAIEAFEQFGPSIGELLKKNAVTAVLLSSLFMLIYIIIRFEWKFGLASIVGVFHDVLVLIALYGLFHIPINNPFIAAVLTVVGYSINDTIVIFDRIRENLKKMQKSKLEPLIDESINQTVFRSLMTALTTVIAIIPLLIMGGSSIREFALPLMIGIIAGAASSIFICSPIYYEISSALNRPRYSGKGSGKGGGKKQIRGATGDGAEV
ncbi:MAG: protein translocase subunit SecD [Clostridiales Family XIII bacterium]|jgi:SecD/SecF fusion protein|nr:protein translocase subunit SecD [Clostridiales Family XIII bacterium]